MPESRELMAGLAQAYGLPHQNQNRGIWDLMSPVNGTPNLATMVYARKEDGLRCNWTLVLCCYIAM